MDETRTIVSLKAQVKDDIKKLEDKLKALEVVERMFRETQQTPLQVQPQVYKRMKQGEAIHDVLRNAGRKLTATEVADALRKGGFGFKSKNPVNSIYVTLKANKRGRYTAEKAADNRTVFGLAVKQSKNSQGEGAVAESVQ